jgi:hypothetical protein
MILSLHLLPNGDIDLFKTTSESLITSISIDLLLIRFYEILGMSVGLSNRTQIAVLKYYLSAVGNHGVPKMVRADKGAETVLAAAAQFAFRRAQKPHIALGKHGLMAPLPKTNELKDGGEY